MLTAQMNVEEVVHELMADVGWLESYQTMQAKVIGKELVRLGTLPATVVKQARSPKTKNEWTLLWTTRKDRPLIPFAAYYTTLQDEDGIYVYKPIISEDGLRIIVLQPHVFRRYRERLDLGDKLKPGQLIRRFMKLNLSGSFMPSGKYKDEPSWSLCTEEGVVLGIYISERVFLGRTFIKYDMAHEGRQADTLREGDENRRNLKLKTTSPRDMIKFAHEAERITKKSEQEQSQKNAGWRKLTSIFCAKMYYEPWKIHGKFGCLHNNWYLCSVKESQTYDRKSIRAVTGKTADFDEIAKDCVAFANREGGHLSIGIEDDQELPPATQSFPESLKDTVVKRLNERTINVALVPNILKAENGGEFLDLEVLRSAVSIASTTKGGYFIRDNDESKPIAPDELMRAIADKPSFSWETKVTSKIKVEQCDQEKLKKLIAKIRESDRVSAFVKGKTVEETLEYYCLVGEDGYLTNLGVLWFGTQPQRARLLFSPTVQFIRYDAGGNKVFKQVWDDYSLNPDELLEDIWRSIPDWSEINEVSDGLWRREIPAYDEKVVREVLCNSIAHRPYTTKGDVFINIYPDRMVVVNPGRLPLGVTPENILRTTVKRNKELSRLFYALHIMEGEGSGYDLMYETQLSVGKTIPVVTEGEDSVAVTLERKIVSKEASRIYDYMQYAYPEVFIHQKAMIAFGLILQEEIISSEALSRKLQLPESGRLRSYVDILCTKNIVMTRGRGKGTKYYVNPDIISNSRANIRTTLKTIEPYRLRELIMQDLKYHPRSLVSEMGVRLPDVPFEELQKYVRKMTTEGTLVFEGGRKFRRYSLP